METESIGFTDTAPILPLPTACSIAINSKTFSDIFRQNSKNDHSIALIYFVKLLINLLIEDKKETPKPTIHAGFRVSNLVRETRLELVRHRHTPLKRACLPVPALAHSAKVIIALFPIKCQDKISNFLHSFLFFIVLFIRSITFVLVC